MVKNVAIRAAAAALALASTFAPAPAAKPLTAAGELSCVIEPNAREEPRATRQLSCRYKPLTGVASSYTGTIVRMAGPPIVDANLVLIWAVKAARSDIAPTSLSGRYISTRDAGAASATKIGALRRDGAVPIELHALTPPPAGSSARTLIFELELEAIKV